MAVSEWRRGTRIETGTVHPKDAVVLSRLAYIATSDFPLGRSSVQERPEEEPRAPKNLLKMYPLLHSTRAFLTIRIYSRSSPASFYRHLTFQDAS